MKSIFLMLPILLSSASLSYAAVVAETSVDIKTKESPDKNQDTDASSKKDDASTTDSTSTNPPSPQLYTPQTDEDDGDEAPKKSRKKGKKGRKSAKAITSLSDEKMPLSKPNAICPIGLEGVDAREIFRGFSYEGFQKAASDGEANLNHGFLPKPWGFYKGKDGVNYAVYAFKPDEKNIGLFLNEPATNFKLSRLKIKEYCALYTEASDDASNKSGPGRVGLVVSRDSFYKPKPLDPGAVKVAAVMSMIQRGEISGVGMADAASSPSSDKKDAKGAKSEKGDKKTAADAKIFEGLQGADKKDDASGKTDDVDALDLPKETDAAAAPDQKKDDAKTDDKKKDDAAVSPKTDDKDQKDDAKKDDDAVVKDPADTTKDPADTASKEGEKSTKDADSKSSDAGGADAKDAADNAADDAAAT